MGIIQEIREKAGKSIKRIVLPEGEEPRTVQAAAIIRKEQLAEPVLLGDPEKILAVARETGTDPDGIRMIHPADSPRRL